MYPNPKTRMGQIWCQILNASTIGLTVAYLLVMFIYPFRPPEVVDGGFISFSGAQGFAFYMLIYLLITLSSFLFLLTALLGVKRYVCVKTNSFEENRFTKAVNILSVITPCLFASGAVTTLTIYLGVDLPPALYTVFSLIAVFCPLIAICALPVISGLKRAELKKLLASGAELKKPTFEVNIYKTPVFIVSIALIVILAACIPCGNERVSFEEDENNYIYDRTNAFAYSYIEIEDSETHETVDRKFLIFPFNYQTLSEIFNY